MKKLTVILSLISFLITTTYRSVQAAPETPNEPQALGIAQGAYLRPATYYGDEVLKFNALVGKDLAAVMYFINWDTSGLPAGEFFNPYHPNKLFEKFGSRSPAIMITWEPVSGKSPGCARNYSGRIPLNDITSGNCDTYIREFAEALQTPPMDQLRFLIRFGHEMNLRESSWWPGHTGQDASAYVAAWRHVHDVFTQVNSTNAEWVWAPNYESNPRDDWNDRNNYYPGDDYVDWIGVDGYNWGSPRWDTFSELYDSSAYDHVLKDFACRYPKPQLITETGSVEGAGSKASWIADTYSRIPNFPFVRGVFWFNDFAYGDPSRADFRVTTSTTQSGNVSPLPGGSNAWTNAYRNALSNSIYTSTLPSVEAATPPTTYCQTSGAQFNAAPANITLKAGERSVHTITGVGYTSTQSLALKVPSGSQITGSFSPTSLQAPFGETVLTLTTSSATPPGVYPVVVQGNGVDLISLQITVYQTYSISGKLLSQVSQEMSGVTIEYQSADRLIRGTVTTRANNTYLIPDLPAKEYIITPQLPEYLVDPASWTVNLTASDIHDVDFTLYARPKLIIDHGGVVRPGSSFNITGQEFPADQVLELYINRVYHPASITTDSTGGMNISLNTGRAETGYYMLTLVAGPIHASIWFQLDENGEAWRENPPFITISDETPAWDVVFLPVVR
ncbi:MAG TPA: glycosyl hydrolase [Anaerolineales bacterium]|nr:glycosyl hydrolase [Anaerolineales bacterium]